MLRKIKGPILPGILALLLMTSCASTDWKDLISPLLIKSEPVEHQIIIQARPKPLSLGKITWHTVTDKELDKFIAKIRKTQGIVVFDAITVQDYETLAKNTAELERYMLQQKEIIKFYEDAINEMNKPTEEEAKKEK